MSSFLVYSLCNPNLSHDGKQVYAGQDLHYIIFAKECDIMDPILLMLVNSLYRNSI